MPSSAPGEGLVDPGVGRAVLLSLADKYDRMLALRRVLGRGTPSIPHRDLLRSLAADYPGALRELEQLTTVEIEERLRACHAARSGLVPEWLLWTARYHARMRALMADKRAGVPSANGRMNVVAFQALAAELGVPAEMIWQRLFPSISPRPHRRG
ncbi:MAG: hypothetical protein ABI321_01145 [Polyangia bacterium]